MSHHLLATLEDVVKQPDVSDVLVSSGTGVWIDRGTGLSRLPRANPDESHVRALAVHLINQGNRHIDEAHPCVDARLPSGLRVHAVLAGVSVGGTTVSIRIPKSTPLTFAELSDGKSLSPEQAERIKQAVDAKQNILICGGSGTGKTTLLSALLALVPESERIVVVEDVTEIRVAHPQVVSLEARPANVEGFGRIDVAELVRHSLRMRADRLVVGEIRGAEIIPFLSALNTGHSGAGSTLHASSLEKVPSRIEALGLMAGVSVEAVSALAVDAFDLVLQLGRISSGDSEVHRRVVAMGKLRLNSKGRLVVDILDRAADI